jgi:hypothetical protein
VTSTTVGSTLRLGLVLGLSLGTACVLDASAAVGRKAQTPAPAQTSPQPDAQNDAQSQPPSQSPSQPQTVVPAPNAPPAVAVETFHPADPAKARYSVQVMEGALERSVRFAASQMNRRLQAVSPDLIQLSGAARARGFRLPGYGVFFDVDVPAALRHTMGWTLRLMQQSDQNVQRALSALRRSLNDLDPKQRAEAEAYLKLLETRFQPPPSRPRMILGPQGLTPEQTNTDQTTTPATEAVRATGNVTMTPVNNGTSTSAAAPAMAGNDATGASGGATAASGAGVAGAEPTAPTAAPTAEDLAWAQNPDLAYEMEVRDALIGAMLEYGSTLSLAPDEYLTVAARDSENLVMPGDLSETVTVLLRIKGSDLADFRAGRLPEADARHRIEIREF